jgi:hypothetical protein
MQTLLRRSLTASGLAPGAAIIGQDAIASSDEAVRWQSVIGIAQADNVVGSETGAVTGGGAPWSTFAEMVALEPQRDRAGTAVSPGAGRAFASEQDIRVSNQRIAP